MRQKRRNGRVTTETSIEDEIEHLRGLDLKGLRARWQSVLQRPAPGHLPRHLLFAIIAYRIQADRFGDLDHETRQLLDRTGAKESGTAMSARLVSFDQKRTELTPGTVLVRDWDRQSQRVMVMADGFAWNGQTYDSLSKVAFAITGTKWNGPRFFGLARRNGTSTRRRVHLIPFTTAIDANAVEKDFQERRLVPELSGILNWALAGLAAYLKEGLNPPKSVLASTQEYRSDMDVVGQWMQERCELDAHASIATGAAYSDYGFWANEELGWALSKLKFRRHLGDRGFASAKGTGGVRLIAGLRLKPICEPGPIGTTDDGSQVYDDGTPKRCKPPACIYDLLKRLDRNLAGQTVAS
jgi:hypothetical protein